jgi:murein DD-endopeptidase MepM/ murein hydrolase activator NlpD
VTSGVLCVAPILSSAPTRPASAAAKASHSDAAHTARPKAVSCVHTVKRGESLSRIAARYHVTRQSIVAANQLGKTETLYAGQHLQITACKATPPSHRGPERAATAVVSRDGSALVARVGPRRIPTSLYIAVPEFHGVAVFQWPIDGPVLSGFGRRPSGWHAGIDIKGEPGMPVLAAAGGVVTVSAWEATYGYLVKIEHPGGFTTVYAHNRENLVEVGDEVKAGAVIATVGRSGRASAFHVHFEIRKGGMAYNPLYLLEASDTPILASTPDMPPHDDTPGE